MLTAWLVAGVAFLLLELVVPGAVLVFLGAGALVVALLVWLGLLTTWVSAITAWFIGSLALLLGLRGLVLRLLPGESETQSTDEELDAYGEVVEVIEAVGPDPGGRIRFRGTTWDALCLEQTIPAGSKARIVLRQDLAWIVDPAEALEAGDLDGDNPTLHGGADRQTGTAGSGAPNPQDPR